MRLDNFIQTAMNNVLKNPVLSVLRDINFSSILKQSNFIKRDIGKSPYLIILHFLYMFIINKRISTFMKQSSDSYKKDVYYRLLKNSKYNWRKLLLLSSVKLISKIHILQKAADTRVLIIDDTVEIKRGKFIEGSCRNLWNNKEHRTVKGLNIVSLNYSDCYTDMMLDFSINYNKNQIVNVNENYFHHKSNAYKRRVEGNNSKNNLALQMVNRVLKSGIYADYLLVDSWYAKPNFIYEIKEKGLDVIARLSKSNRIWQFTGKYKTLESLYIQTNKTKTLKIGNYNSIKYSYASTTTTHKTLGRIKIVFIKTKDNLIPIVSTNINLSDIEIINTYKKRWNIEQGYKDLREYFQFGKEENRIYEALIARITLSFLAYNLTSYINRINNEPQTLGELFRNLECQLETLAISMELFIKILEQLAQAQEIVKRNKDLEQIIHMLRVYTKKQLGFICES
ncbi:transposase [Arcobacter lacus]|nr:MULTISPECIES: transposase [Arcobacteraceae]MCT7595927.1 transposase [Aliarcobacter butzleri]MCT7630053.1 transposase [Aliarcobacter butzleri]MCT7908079.1 transposase [Arcobacter lacus]